MGNVPYTTEELAELRQLWIAARCKDAAREVEAAKASLERAKQSPPDDNPINFLNQVHSARLHVQAMEVELSRWQQGAIEVFDRQGFEPTD